MKHTDHMNRAPKTAYRHGGIVISLLVFVCLAAQTGCFSQDDRESKPAGTLTILNWEDYIEMGVVKSFEEQFGVTVVVKTFANEDEMISLVQSNPGVYDLAVASGSVVRILIETGLIAPIGKQNIPNISGVDPEFSNTPDDPTMAYSVPYLWGTSGIAFNRLHITADTIDWEMLFDERYSGRIDMLNDIQEDFAPALKVIDRSINTRDTKDLIQAEAILKKQRRIIRGYFDSQEIQKHLLDGSTHIALIYSGDGLRVAEQNPDIRYVVPPSGAPIWLDSWVIPTTSANKDTAEAFINYILEPETIAVISNEFWYANAVSASKRYLNTELLHSGSIYLTPELLARCEYYLPPDEQTNQFFNRVWYELLR